MTPFRGLYFLHSRVLNARNEPQEYVVTKIAKGTVYYRPVDGGSPDCCNIEQFWNYAKPQRLLLELP
jgi:hypothetical protein